MSWIDETGELYARELAYGSDRFVVLGCFDTRDAVEAFMQGWSAGERRKELTWITQRMV